MSYIQSNQIVILEQDVDLEISPTDSGKILITPQTAGAVDVTYTLPAVASGLHYRFVNGAEANLDGSVIIMADAGDAKTMFGNAIMGPRDGIGMLEIHEASRIVFEDAQSALGDFVDLYCDGKHWFVDARSRVTEGISIA